MGVIKLDLDFENGFFKIQIRNTVYFTIFKGGRGVKHKANSSGLILIFQILCTFLPYVVIAITYHLSLSFVHFQF